MESPVPENTDFQRLYGAAKDVVNTSERLQHEHWFRSDISDSNKASLREEDRIYGILSDIKYCPSSWIRLAPSRFPYSFSSEISTLVLDLLQSTSRFLNWDKIHY